MEQERVFRRIRFCQVKLPTLLANFTYPVRVWGHALEYISICLPSRARTTKVQLMRDANLLNCKKEH